MSAASFPRQVALCRGLWREIVAIEPDTDALDFIAWAHRAGYVDDPRRLIKRAYAAARMVART